MLVPRPEEEIPVLGTAPLSEPEEDIPVLSLEEDLNEAIPVLSLDDEIPILDNSTPQGRTRHLAILLGK